MRALTALILLGLSTACTVGTPSAFGQQCTNPDICEGLQCRPSPDDGELRCLPPRGPAEPGEQCAAPFVTTSPGTGKTILDQLVYVGGAVDDVKLSCNAVEAPEVVLRFTVADDDGDAATEAPGVRIRLEGENADQFALSLRAAGCGDELPFGCTPPAGDDIVLQALAPGDYELVVEGAATGTGVAEQPAHVIVERLDCPANALPFDSERCIRTLRIGASLAPRVGHTVHTLDDGSIVVIGGDSGAGPRADFEVLDPTTGRWSFGSLAVGGTTANHGATTNGQRIQIFGGSQGVPQLLDVSAFRRADVSTVFGRRQRHVALTEVESVALGDRVFSVSNDHRRGSQLDLGGTYVSSLECLNDDCSIFDLDTGVQYSFVFTERVNLLAINDSLVAISGSLSNEFDESIGPLSVAVVSSESIDFRTIEGAVARSRAALIAPNRQQFLAIGGFSPERTVSDVVERYDFVTERLVTLPPLPTRITNPRTGLLGDLVLIVGDEAAPLLMNPETGAQVRVPNIIARTGSRLAVGDDSITIIGGSINGTPTAVVERVELVGRVARTPDAPGCFATPITGSGTIAGTTEGRGDVFRSERCDSIGLGTNFGRDTLYTFSLAAPGSLRVSGMTDDDSLVGNAHRLVLLRGRCDEAAGTTLEYGLGLAYEEVACGDGDGDLTLFAGDLPAGDYTLVFEHDAFNPNDIQVPFSATGFTANILLGPPLTCPLDAADPVDDTPAGATYLAATDDAAINGRLCPDDIDNIIFERGTDDDISVDGIPADLVVYQRAVIDVPASIAARRPVASGVVGDALTDLDDAPAGVYIARLAAEAQVDFIEWSAAYFTGCDRDAGDSLVAELDNANVAFADTLTPGEDTILRFCATGDRDTVILDPDGDTGAMNLRISGEPADSNIEFFAIVDGVLGAPLALRVEVDPRSEFDSFVDLGVLTEPIAVRISVDDDSDSRDVEFAALQPGDICENALPLSPEPAESGTLTGDVARFSADIDAVLLGDCTGFREPGRDTVYAVDLDAGATLELLATGLDSDTDNDGVNDGEADLAVYILKDCDSSETSCVAGVDANNRGTPETLTFTNETGSPATFYVVVDSFYGEVYAWQLEWSISAP